MKKQKKELHLCGRLMSPLIIGKSVLIAIDGQIYHTSRVVALYEQNHAYVHFETLNTHYHLSLHPFPLASIRPPPVRLAICA